METVILDDKKIRVLGALFQNSRQPLARVAEQAGLSREVATYHFNQLVKDKIIFEFVTDIAVEHLGFIGAFTSFNVKVEAHQRFAEYINKLASASWAAEWSGFWSYGMSIYGKTPAELDALFAEIYRSFGNDILEHRFALHKHTLHFYQKYIGLPATLPDAQHIGQPPREVDDKDKYILRMLSHNSRIDNTELARDLGLSAVAISKRITNLEQAGIIQTYSLFLDVTRLGLYQHSVFINNKPLANRRRVLDFVTKHPAISFIAEYIGDPFFELGIFVKEPYELRSILQEIETSLPESRILEVSLLQKEFVSTGPPPCIFG